MHRPACPTIAEEAAAQKEEGEKSEAEKAVEEEKAKAKKEREEKAEQVGRTSVIGLATNLHVHNRPPARQCAAGWADSLLHSPPHKASSLSIVAAAGLSPCQIAVHQVLARVWQEREDGHHRGPLQPVRHGVFPELRHCL